MIELSPSNNNKNDQTNLTDSVTLAIVSDNEESKSFYIFSP